MRKNFFWKSHNFLQIGVDQSDKCDTVYIDETQPNTN
jgi:hypothetical protein